MLSRKKILWISAGTALLYRLIFTASFISSPYRFYHEVPGLDMQTLLRFGEWGSSGNCFFFTPHRLLVWLCWRFHNFVHLPEAVIAVQALLGILLTAAIADAVLKLCGSRRIALAAGIAAALNPVGVIYEFSTLQDSMLTAFAFFGFWAILQARKHRFAPHWALLAGALIAWSTLGRPASLLLAAVLGSWVLYYLYRKKKRHLAPFFAAGALLVWGGACAANAAGGAGFNCFFNPVPYTVSYNAGTENKAAAVNSQAVRTTVFKMAKRIPAFFVPRELPENLNIYFLRKQFFVLNLPFEYLMIAAFLGAVLALFKLHRKEGLVLVCTFSLLALLCVREPIGRYRLMLLPWFILLGAFALQMMLRRRSAGMLLLAVFIFSEFFLPKNNLVRASDYTAWGWAIEGEAHKTTPESLKNFYRAFLMRPDNTGMVNVVTRAAALNIPQFALQKVIEPGKKSPLINQSLLHYYEALLLMPDAARAGTALLQVKPEELPPLFQFRYYFLCGEAIRLRNRPEARIFYRKALQIPVGDPALRPKIEGFLK